jgi:hypothetical protein
MHRFHQRALAGAARPPQQDVVRREAGGEPLRVVEQDVAHAVDAAQQVEIDAVDRRDRLEPLALGVPDEGVGGGDVGRRVRRRREALERVGNAA